MPCTDGGVPYPESRLEILTTLTPQMLCAVLSAMSADEGRALLDKVDWKEAGVSRNRLEEWWRLHQQHDQARKHEVRRVRELHEQHERSEFLRLKKKFGK